MQRFRNLQHVISQCTGFQGFTHIGWNPDSFLHMDNAHNIVMISTIERKTRVPGRTGLLYNLCYGRRIFEHRNPPSRSHHLGSGKFSKTKRAIHKSSRIRIQGSLLRRATHHCRKLFGTAGSRKFLLSLHAEETKNPIGRPVHHDDHRFHDARKYKLRGGNLPRHPVRFSDRNTFRHQFTEEH